MRPVKTSSIDEECESRVDIGTIVEETEKYSLNHVYTSVMAHDLGMIYPILVSISGVVSGVIFILSIILSYRRQQIQYLSISIALGGLAARSGVAAFEIAGVISFHLHHTLEHALDGVIAVALLAAIISMGAPQERTRGST